MAKNKAKSNIINDKELDNENIYINTSVFNNKINTNKTPYLSAIEIKSNNYFNNLLMSYINSDMNRIQINLHNDDTLELKYPLTLYESFILLFMYYYVNIKIKDNFNMFTITDIECKYNEYLFNTDDPAKDFNIIINKDQNFMHIETNYESMSLKIIMDIDKVPGDNFNMCCYVITLKILKFLNIVCEDDNYVHI